MSKNKELAKNTVIIFIGKFCTQFLSFFLLPFYTSILSTKQYGSFDLISTYISLLIPFVTLELSNALFRFLIDERENHKNKQSIFINIFTGVLFLLVLSLIILYIINLFVAITYINYIALGIISIVLSTLLLQTARGLGNNIQYTIGSVITAIVNIILNIVLLVFFKMRVDGLLISLIVSNISCFIYLFFKLKIFNLIDKKLINKKEIKRAIKYSAPLIPNSISWWIVSVSDRTMVSYMISVAANGIYSVANKFSGLFIGVYNVFNLSLTESISLHINDKDRDSFLENILNLVIKVFSSIGLGIIAIIPLLFNILIGKQFLESYNYIPLLIIGSIFNIVVGLFGTVYVAKKLTKEIAKTSVFAALINIGINLFAIKWIGIYGACLSTIAAFAAMAIYRYIDVQKYVSIKIKLKTVVELILMFSISIYLYYINNIVGNIINIVLVLVYSIYTNKEIITKSFKLIKTKYLVRR